MDSRTGKTGADTNALLQAGIAAAQAGDAERARRLLAQVVWADGENVQAWRWLSRVADTPHLAAYCRQRARALEPDDESGAGTIVPSDERGVENWLQAGIAAARAGQRERARGLLARVLRQDNQNLPAWLWMGGVMDDRRAREYCLERVLDLDPHHQAAARGLEILRRERAQEFLHEGIAAAQSGQHEQAYALLVRALAWNEDNAQIWLWLGAVAKSPDEQRQHLQKALSLDPGLDAAQAGLEQAQEQGWVQLSLFAEPGHAVTAAVIDGVSVAVPAPVPVLLPPSTAADTNRSAAPILAPATNVPAPTETMAAAAPRERLRALPVIRALPTLSIPGWARRVFGSDLGMLAVAGVVLLLLVALGVEGLPAPLPFLRLALGLLFILAVPGYTLHLALFPRADDLDVPARLALSFGLSVAVIPPMALILDQLPWGVRLAPIVVAEGLFIITCSVIVWLRRRRLAAGELFSPALDLGAVDLKGWWAAQNSISRILYRVLAASLLGVLVAAAAILFLPRASDRFTEFYVLGPEGLAEGYPRQAVAGQPVAVTMGIANREGQETRYRVEIRVGGEQIREVGPILLEDEQVWEDTVSYTMPAAGDDQQVEFLLYRNGGEEPYRSLYLWIDVLEGE
ncbi:MAG: DUF1616 domain-containing protein [Anaerolineae bacterium]|nr:DUF1616 domain-containing protein [Anaerolineae bacterium]